MVTIKSFGATAVSASRNLGGGPNSQDAAQRDADFDMAKRKQVAAERRVKQQLDAQELNNQRLELQRKADELDAERVPMRREHAASLTPENQV